MNKKILIATVFATLMLFVPINSVVGVSDVEDDCGCQVVNRYDLYRVKLFLVRIKVVTNILLLRFEHIPEIGEKCQEIMDGINSNKQLDYPIICDILEQIFNWYINISNEIMDLIIKYEDNPLIRSIYVSIFIPVEFMGYYVWNMGLKFDCDL